MTEEAKPRKTAMICAFEGWNDACQAATNVIRHLLSRYDAREVRYIRCDGYYDYQVTRPMTCTVTGRRRILWPQTTFYDIQISEGTHVFAQIAPEPNYRWIEYSRQSLRIAEEFDVERIVTMGSMFADCPHTRPLPLDESDDSCRCDMDREYNGPVGIPTVLDSIACEDGFSTSTLWVSIPQYLGSDDCAQATLQMLERLSKVLGIELDEGDLPRKAKAWKAQASVLTRCNDELADYVRKLERKYDMELNARIFADLGTPQAEQLVKETEEYLSHMQE
ncbi:PAC2 family protein [Bifidobacterium sp.]|jgi:predicted ATP-grasp superfamily ATP-dependent carboligase|uniref:PAC2 family protein n=1 Tax=Bifidobacterium sp. TaxID=41200 RepID=UPI0025C38532|nr:PAC2 family protein [Bifidobacterium sp.]MCH4208695.1 PAC2 family protein [Bifidobacterium sp.]MCI1224333.1 PAC2 family protein [Bifidobacterium sp.]